MSDATFNDSVCIFPREFIPVGICFRVGCSIGVTFEGDRRYCDDRACGKLFFQIVIFRLTFSQSEAPTVIVNDDIESDDYSKKAKVLLKKYGVDM